MMEIERPKIEMANLSPDGRYGKFVWNRWSVASARLWATACAACSFPACPAWP